MKWKELLARTDLVGGQIEIREDGDVYRGPISAITERDGQVTIKSEWVETRPQGSEGEWARLTSAPNLSFGLEYVSDPRDLGDGRIGFSISFLGSSIITPKDWSESASAEGGSLELPEGVQYDWEIVVKLKPKGYAEFRTADGKRLFHGPVKEVRVNEFDYVVIHFTWLATVPLTDIGLPDGDWEAASSKANPTTFPNFVVPFEVEDTPEKGPRLRFGLNILYLKEVEGLDPDTVKGLVLPASESA